MLFGGEREGLILRVTGGRELVVGVGGWSEGLVLAYELVNGGHSWKLGKRIKLLGEGGAWLGMVMLT